MVFLGVILLLVIGTIVVLLATGATLVFSSGHRHFYIQAGIREKLKPVARDRYERILSRFLVGDLFDRLWVSRIKGPNAGIILRLEDGQVKISATFYLPRDADQLAAFRLQMTEWGYERRSGDPRYQGDKGFLAYLVPADNRLLDLVDRILAFLQGPHGEVMFVHMWRSGDVLGEAPIRIRPKRNFLSRVP